MKLICYLKLRTLEMQRDGCHLRKHARNSVRSNLSKTAVKLSSRFAGAVYCELVYIH